MKRVKKHTKFYMVVAKISGHNYGAFNKDKEGLKKARKYCAELAEKHKEEFLVK